jgi:hypothetical protein
MLGRGSRDGGDYKGKLFLLQSKNTEKGVMQMLERDVEPKFSEGCDWLRMIKKLVENGEEKYKRLAQKICEETGGRWRMTRNELLEKIATKKTIAALNDALKSNITSYEK